MNGVETGANGVLVSYLLEYFSVRADYVVGAVRLLLKPQHHKKH